MPQAPVQPAPMHPGMMPPQMRAMTLPKILRIGIIQGGKIVEERLVRKRESVTVGQSTKNSFVIPTEALPKSFTLFELLGNGGYALNFSDGMDGRISLGDQVLPLPQCKQGLAQRRGHLWQLPLNDRARGKVVVGDATILFQFVAPPPPQPRPQLPPSVRGSVSQTLDWFLIAILGLSLIGHFGFVAYLRTVDWPRKPNLEDVPDRFVQVVAKPQPVMPETKIIVQDKGKGVEVKKEGGGGGGTGRKGGGKKTAEQMAADAEARARAEAERRARLAEQARALGVNMALGHHGEGGNVRNLLENGSPGGDQEKALSGLQGVGVARGSGGGLPGIKVGGGGGTGNGKVAGIGDLRAGAVGGGGTGEKGPESAPKGFVRRGGEAKVTSGEADPRGVSQVISDSMGLMKSCYDRELKRNPELKGRITLVITIKINGQVGGVDADDNDLGDEVLGCIKARIQNLRFPPAKGGEAEVKIPLIFTK
jgi:hypothetical protein